MPMFNDITKPAPPLPTPALTEIALGVLLLRPLSRRATGPGLIILTTTAADSDSDSDPDPLAIEDGVPSPLVKWAEEGYTVVELRAAALQGPSGKHRELLNAAVEALRGCDRCEPKDKIGLVAYAPELWNAVAPLLAAQPSIAAAAIYADAAGPEPLADAAIPVVHHLAGKKSSTAAPRREQQSDAQLGQPDSPPNTQKSVYYYPNVASHRFATPFQPAFHYNAEGIAHSRNLALLKAAMGGVPRFDLEAIWEEHTFYEFADRSVEHTMSTMVQEPYVNHVPTLTGGIGRARLSSFYRHNFIFNNSEDVELELISRTLGIDRIVDEFIFKFTHDQMVDWILPGVPPTNKKIEVPMTAVVNIRGDRLYHEHIAWDQGTVLRQIGLLPEYLPFPYPVPGQDPPAQKQVEYRVPVTGADTAAKMRDRNAVPSNEMFDFEIRHV